MHSLKWLALSFCGLTTFVHVLTNLIVAVRCFIAGRTATRPVEEPVSILRPVCGVDPNDAITLRSSFHLEFPDYELIFCCQDEDDPVVSLVKSLMAQYPESDARLLIGPDHSTPNPKLNNLVKGWEEAKYDWVVLSDCNVLLPRDYLGRLFDKMDPRTGLVCSPPIGSEPQGFWAKVECAFLNTYQARWQYAADTFGFGFAQGKTMFWARSDLDAYGGIRALGAEIAEDAAATKFIRSLGKRVRLVDRPFLQPLGHRSFRQVWMRQLRWARLRRATFLPYFLPEIFSPSLLPLMAGAWGASLLHVSWGSFVLVLAAVWYGSEAALARLCGWPLGISSAFTYLLRDTLLPWLWVQAWLGNDFRWRETEMTVARKNTGKAVAEREAALWR